MRDQAVSEREEERQAGWERAHAARLKRECWAGGWAAREGEGWAAGKWAAGSGWSARARRSWVAGWAAAALGPSWVGFGLVGFRDGVWVGLFWVWVFFLFLFLFLSKSNSNKV